MTNRGKPLRKNKSKVRGGKLDRFFDPNVKQPHVEKPCFVCGEKTLGWLPVGAWDAPCCKTHDLAHATTHVDVRIDGKVRFRLQRKS